MQLWDVSITDWKVSTIKKKEELQYILNLNHIRIIVPSVLTFSRMDGNVIEKYNISKENNSLNLETLPSGMYVIKLADKGSYKILKLKGIK